jgi:hypothetical protein
LQENPLPDFAGKEVLWMEFRYRRGNQIPPNVVDAIRFTAKTGFITREIWIEFFAQGGTRAKQKQLAFMLTQKILEPHSCKPLHGVYELGSYGKALLLSNNCAFVSAPASHFLSHDELVATSVLKLKNLGLVDRWVSEAEQKSKNDKEFALELGDRDRKFPDAVLAMKCQTRPAIVAIEYERSGKTIRRYRRLLEEYSILRQIDLILVIARDEAISKRIEKARRESGLSGLSDRLGYAIAHEWATDPARSSILINDDKTTLETLLGNLAA